MRKLLRINAVAGYRGKRYRDYKSLPREALKNSGQQIPLLIDIRAERFSVWHTRSSILSLARRGLYIISDWDTGSSILI